MNLSTKLRWLLILVAAGWVMTDCGAAAVALAADQPAPSPTAQPAATQPAPPAPASGGATCSAETRNARPRSPHAGVPARSRGSAGAREVGLDPGRTAQAGTARQVGQAGTGGHWPAVGRIGEGSDGGGRVQIGQPGHCRRGPGRVHPAGGRRRGADRRGRQIRRCRGQYPSGRQRQRGGQRVGQLPPRRDAAVQQTGLQRDPVPRLRVGQGRVPAVDVRRRARRRLRSPHPAAPGAADQPGRAVQEPGPPESHQRRGPHRRP